MAGVPVPTPFGFYALPAPAKLGDRELTHVIMVCTDRKKETSKMIYKKKMNKRKEVDDFLQGPLNHALGGTCWLDAVLALGMTIGGGKWDFKFPAKSILSRTR